MKSKPIYAALRLDPTARKHLFVTQGPNGQKAACRALAADSSADAILLTLDDPALDDSAEYAALGAALAKATLDTAFYVAGPEKFLWQITGRLRQAGAESRRIQRELAGSDARRVYCVHCRAMNEEVTTTLHSCTACGLVLTVRDHFSRPLSAYMGVLASEGIAQ